MQQSLVVSSHATSAKRKRDIGKNVVHPMTLLPPGVCLGQHQQQASSTTSDSKTMKTSKFLSVSTNNNQEIGRTLDGFFLLDCCRGMSILIVRIEC
jgi:hypothetical protein